MVTFTILLSLITCTVTGLFIYVQVKEYKHEQETVEKMAISKVTDNVQNKITIANNIANYIGESQSRIDNIRSYLRNNPEAYSKKILNDSYRTGTYFNWPKTSGDFYANYSNLKTLSVKFDNDNTAFTSDINNTSGKIVKTNQAFSSEMIYSSIVSPQENAVVGLVGVNFDNHELKRNLNIISGRMPLQLIVTSSDGRFLYHYASTSVTKSEKDEVSRLIKEKRSDCFRGQLLKKTNIDSEFQIYTFYTATFLKKILILRLLPLIFGGILVLAILLISFRITFNRYRKQLSNIVNTTKRIGEFNLDERIKVDDKQSYEDLNILSHSINHMLDDINDYIDTIYKMKIAQQEAHMKALQAQISPHFMANTLEYIRMSALDIGARDLAKVVYSFSSLLRSNVDNHVQSTIKDEAKLIKNYIYLYQVRFPDRLAFQIDILPELMDIKIPKFTLQPIIENYFAHGVDFAEKNNAIEVKGRIIDNRVVIKVIDNGKSLDINELSKLNLKLQEPISGDHSIGLQNVYARMNNYTKNFRMKITNNQYGGITVSLSFDYKG